MDTPLRFFRDILLSSSASPFAQRIRVALGIILFGNVFGVVGFMTIEDYPFLNALFMTVITISTVGFGEVEPLSTVGKLFTTFLILFNLGGVTYAVTVFSSYFLDGSFQSDYLQYRLNRMIDQMNQHVVVCGYGRNGRQACSTLESYGVPYVVIEKDSETETLLNRHKIPHIMGNAVEDDLLESAGIHKARGLITTLPRDAENVFVVLTARSMSADLHIISRASYSNSEHKLRIAGANSIIMPDKVGGSQMATLITKPDLMEFVDIIMGQGASHPSLEEINFEELRPQFRHKSLRELDIRSHTGCNVVGFKHRDQGYIINPEPELTLDEQTKIIALGTEEQIKTLRQFFVFPQNREVRQQPATSS
jgi:voltage-gated potassium channel